MAAALLVACDDARQDTEARGAPVGRTAADAPAGWTAYGVGCADRAEGPPGLPVLDRRRDFVAGPITFYGLRDEARRARTHLRSAFRSQGDAYAPVKILAGVRAGTDVRVEIARASRHTAGMLYGSSVDRGRRFYARLEETDSALLFTACPADEPRHDAGVVGAETTFSGGFVVTKPTCLRLRVDGTLHRLPYGRSC